MRITFFLFLILLSHHFILKSQSLPELSFPVTVDSKQLKNPFNGGLDTPQFSEVDLNNDGLKDIYVYDFTGKKNATYLNIGTRYKYAPTYAKNFPSIAYFVLLRDFDGDGIMDLFTLSDSVNGIKVYKGFFELDQLNFKLLTVSGNSEGLLSYEVGGGQNNILEITETIYPAIDDIDGDGDLDIISIEAGYFQWYQNRSVENGWGLDSLVFKKESDCFGGALEDGTSLDLLLASAPGNCAPMFLPPNNDQQFSAHNNHNGYSILTYDNDGDGDKDLLFGDRTYVNMNLLENTGISGLSHFGNQDILFPSYDLPINSQIIPTAFYLDVDFDEVKDLIVASRISPISLDSYTLFYKNNGTTEKPEFSFVEADWLTNESIDFGKICHPAFTDYNQDGLQDMVLGTQIIRMDEEVQEASLVLLENTGSLSHPEFTLVDLDWLGMSAYDAYWKRPSFGDLDGDGDEDLLIGEDKGRLIYFENIGGLGAPYDFANPVFDYMEIDVEISIGTSASPQIVDMDDDGLMDIIIGLRSGNIAFYKNLGNIGSPFFEPDPFAPENDFELGEVSIPNLGSPVPTVVEIDGKKRMFVGNSEGTIWEYGDIEGQLFDTFTMRSVNYGAIEVGDLSSPALEDIDRNGYLDMLVGNLRGGLNVFATNLYVGNEIVNTSELSEREIKVFPNPAVDRIYLEGTGLAREIICYNILGEQIPVRNTKLDYIDISGLISGTYLLKVNFPKDRKVIKFIKQ